MAKTRATRPGRLVLAGDAELPLDALEVGPSLRVEGLDPRHVATLAELDGSWPPIVVRREDRSVVDGQHRVAAARRLGLATLQVTWFDGSAEDAFVEFVRCNVGHGLPLGLEERRSAASRILRLASRAIGPERRVAVRRLPQDRCPAARTTSPAVRRSWSASVASVATVASGRSIPPSCGPASRRSSTRRPEASLALDRRRRRLVARDRAQRAREAPGARSRTGRARAHARGRDRRHRSHRARTAHPARATPATGSRATRRSAAGRVVASSSSGSTTRPSTPPTTGPTSGACRGAGSTRWPTKPAVGRPSGATSPTRSKARFVAAPSTRGRASESHVSEEAPMPKVELPYAINDADNHFNEPLDLYERYIDPKPARPGDPLRHRRRRSRAAAVRGSPVEVRHAARSPTRPTS